MRTRTTPILVSALATLVLAGCGGTPFSEAPGADPAQQGQTDAGQDAGSQPATQADTGSPNQGDDAGTPGDPGDDAAPPPANDAGSPDTGSAVDDAGTGTPIEAGPTPEPDSGSPDSGAVADSGTAPDSGSSTPQPDASSPDSGGSTPDAGTSPDSGSSEPDSGSDDDASEPPLCTNSATTCSGNQPMTCQNGAWVANGGLCNYGCNAGACLCNDPAEDGGGRFEEEDGHQVLDTSTGETWIAAPTTHLFWTDASAACASLGARLPMLSELQNILAEQPQNLSCSSFDADSQFQSGYGLGMTATWYWTETTMAVNFATGTVEGPEPIDPSGGDTSPSLGTVCITP